MSKLWTLHYPFGLVLIIFSSQAIALSPTEKGVLPENVCAKLLTAFRSHEVPTSWFGFLQSVWAPPGVIPPLISVPLHEVDAPESETGVSEDKPDVNHKPIPSFSRQPIDLKEFEDSYPISADETSGKVRFVYRRIQLVGGGLLRKVVDTQVFHKSQLSPKMLQQLTAQESDGFVTGRSVQKIWLDEILSEIYPDYVSRRRWSMSFIDHDYVAALRTADHTRYIAIYAQRSPDTWAANGWAPWRLIAAMGLNEAPYGTITSFNASTGQWEQSTGAFGPAHDTFSLESESVGESPVLALKVEDYSGVAMARPSVVYAKQMRSDSTPIYYGAGIIFEPVKFFLARKELLRDIAQTELVAALIKSFLPDGSYRDQENSAKYLYTFNRPEEGRKLYGPRGWEILPQTPELTKDGEKWAFFGESLLDFVKKFYSVPPSQADTNAGAFIRSMQEAADKFQFRN